jgi:hypothetical protein
MASLSVSPPRSHSTSSLSELSYDIDSRLKVEINTPGLYIRSVEANQAEYERYHALNEKIRFMTYFAVGDRWNIDAVAAKVDEWAKAWKEQAVYKTAFSIFEKSTRDFKKERESRSFFLALNNFLT